MGIAFQILCDCHVSTLYSPKTDSTLTPTATNYLERVIHHLRSNRVPEISTLLYVIYKVKSLILN
jgi:hypothetical protein